MTREEAIRQIENRWSIMDYGESEALGEALDMAIEALSTYVTAGEYPNDLINRNALMEYCSNQKSKSIDNNDIARFPSADVKQGEWIKHKGEWVDLDFYPTKYECSQCHYCVDEGYDSIFCPNCGAKMKGGAE